MYGIQIDIHQINTFHFYGYVVFLISFQAYDQHLNMILSEVEETITTVEIDEETYEELFKVKTHYSFWAEFGHRLETTVLHQATWVNCAILKTIIWKTDWSPKQGK